MDLRDEFSADQLKWLSALWAITGGRRTSVRFDSLARMAGLSREESADVAAGMLIASLIEQVDDETIRLTPEGQALAKRLNGGD